MFTALGDFLATESGVAVWYLLEVAFLLTALGAIIWRRRRS